MLRNQNKSANFLLHDKALFHLDLFPGKGIRQRRVKFSWGWSTRWPMLWPSSSARPWWGRWVLCPRLVRQPWQCASTSPPRLSLLPEGRFIKHVCNCKNWIKCIFWKKTELYFFDSKSHLIQWSSRINLAFYQSDIL